MIWQGRGLQRSHSSGCRHQTDRSTRNERGRAWRPRDQFSRGIAARLPSKRGGCTDRDRKSRSWWRSAKAPRYDRAATRGTRPRREPPEVGECFYGKNVVTCGVDVAVDAVGVGPISLDRDGRKAFFLDKPLGDLGALVVKLMRAVGCFAEQHEARVADR